MSIIITINICYCFLYLPIPNIPKNSNRKAIKTKNIPLPIPLNKKPKYLTINALTFRIGEHDTKHRNMEKIKVYAANTDT